MGYRIDIDHSGCITCGICMDVCPVEALDMSRPQAPGVETGPGPGRPMAWMMEHPLQVGECIGCGICIGECPPNVMTLVEATGEVPLAARQGPIDRPARRRAGHLAPAVARDPRGPQARPRLAVGRPVHVADAIATAAVAGLDVDGRRCATQPHRSVPGRVSRRHRRGAVRRPDRRRTLRRGLRRRGRGQSVPVRSAAGSARRRARAPAGAGCWTSRSRSGRSSDSRPSTARSPRSSRRRYGALSAWRSSVAGPPACPRPGTWPASATP